MKNADKQARIHFSAQHANWKSTPALTPKYENSRSLGETGRGGDWPSEDTSNCRQRWWPAGAAGGGGAEQLKLSNSKWSVKCVQWCSARWCRTHRGVTGSLKISPLALLPCPPCPPCPPCCLPTRAVLLIGNNRISLTWSLDTGSMTYRNMVKGGMHGCKLLIGMIMQ